MSIVTGGLFLIMIVALWDLGTRYHHEAVDIAVINWQYEVMEISTQRIPRIRAELDHIAHSIDSMTAEKHPESTGLLRNTYKKVFAGKGCLGQ